MPAVCKPAKHATLLDKTSQHPGRYSFRIARYEAGIVMVALAVKDLFTVEVAVIVTV
jgi:hypothetical protein